MLFFLQITSKIPTEADVLKRLPTFSEWTENYGPFLGLVLALVILLVIAQYVWYRKLIKAKDNEIERLVKREEELNKRLTKFVDSAMKKAK